MFDVPTAAPVEGFSIRFPLRRRRHLETPGQVLCFANGGCTPYFCHQQQQREFMGRLGWCLAGVLGFYGIGNGTGTDTWGVTGRPIFNEDNPTSLTGKWRLFGLDKIPHNASTILIQEPCNTVSNIVYYLALLAVCEYDTIGGRSWTLPMESLRGVIQGFDMLAHSSSLWHASGTDLGLTRDKFTIAVAAFSLYQGTMASLPYSPEIFDLQRNVSRTYTAVEVAKIASTTFVTEPVAEWRSILKALDLAIK